MATVASSPRMVGRDHDLAAMLAALESSSNGQPVTILVRGEAGIGKTRLLQEFHAAVAERSWDKPVVTATGQCLDLGPVGAAFGPVRRLLRDVWAEVGPDAFVAAAQSPAILATLGTLVPEVVVPDGAVTGGSEFVTEAIETLVENLSADHQLVLVLEDLHWADASTLALLKTLATTLRGGDVIVVLTYRSDDVDRFHPLRPVIAELERNRAVLRVELERLNPAEVMELAGGIASSASSQVGPDLADRSGGIPFLVEELLGLGDGELPDTLRDLLLSRYERLSDAARTVVRVASAGGVHVEHDVLLEVSGESAEVLDDALREAIEARVLVSDGDGYAFRHALTQEGVHDDLLASERIRFHTAYGEALERSRSGGGSVESAEIAFHWRLARDPRRALAATVAAFDEARARDDVFTILKLADSLADLWPQVPDADDVAGRGLWEVLAEATAASLRGDDPVRGVRLADEGLALCPVTARRTRARLLLLKRMQQYNAGIEGDPALLREAADLLADSDEQADEALLAQVLSHTIAFGEGTGQDAAAVMQRALEMVHRSGSADDVVRVIMAHASNLIQEGRVLEGVEVQSQVASLPVGPLAKFTAVTYEMDSWCYLGEYDRSIDRGEAAIEELKEAGLERSIGAEVAANLIEATIAAGRPARALELLPRSLQLTRGAPWISYLGRLMAAHHAWNDNVDGAAEMRALGPAEVRAADAEERAGWARVDAERLLGEAIDAASAQDRNQLTAQALSAVALLTRPETEMWFYLLPIIPAAARAVGAGRRHHVPVDPALEAGLADLLASLPDYPIATAWTALAGAELGGADPAAPEAVPGWQAAVAALEEVRAPVWYLPYAHYRLAEALIAHGDRDAAVGSLQFAAEFPAERGVAIVSRWARELAARAGLTMTPAGHTRAGTSSHPTGIDSLTAREQQVLALLAEGLSNPEIGRQLFISPKTVSVHVSAIFGKTGTGSRAEAAAYFVAHRAPTHHTTDVRRTS
ncbi:AAA family ATPase [Ornithinimicrobium sp. F0845]|uniref:helix-turn-helix transcriptional regulator n=1 Tax=Ornithinimicrobium sp. F0845 TaxID=2926412 RepID=UPI001FF132FE|nr:LuxR family transcriptional regulator [Ornithinimicrobium sp. F0845]MCK0113342.1 AAA family ATPase [Ornithinimicrobium sp. F0845]